MFLLMSGQHAAASTLMDIDNSYVTTPGGITGDVSKPEAYITWYESTLMSREVMKDAAIEELDLPEQLYACAVTEDDSYFEYVAVEWDMKALNISVPGSYTVIGRWSADNLNIDAGQSIVPEMPVRVYGGPEPLRLPDFIENDGSVARYVFDGTTLYDCDDIRVYRSLDEGPFELMEGEFEYGSFVSSEVNVSACQLDYADIVFKLFNLDADKVYSYKVEVVGGLHAGMSNAVVVAKEMPNASEGNSSDDTDGGNSGKRGGGGRYGAGSREEKIELTKKMMENFIRLNPAQTMLELNGIKVVVATDIMQNLLDITDKCADLALESLGQGVYMLSLTVDGDLRESLGGEFTVYFPYEDDCDGEWSNITVLCNGQAVSFTVDEESKAIVVGITRTGVYEIKDSSDVLSENSYWSGVLGWIKYWWLTMTGISWK